MSKIAEYAPNVPGAVVARQVLTPLDLERTYGLTEGNIFHGDLSLEQLFFMRPVPGWARYRTPIDGLYLCGAGSASGGRRHGGARLQRGAPGPARHRSSTLGEQRELEDEMAKKGILERLNEGVVLGDGGYLLELEKRGWVQAGPFTPEVVLMRPQAVKELHTEFKTAGAEVLQALTFYASRDKLGTVGLADKLEDMNRAAVRLCREVAGDDCLVAGNISLTWMYEPDSPKAKDTVPPHLRRAARACRSRRASTSWSARPIRFLGEALLAVECGKKTGLPTMVTVCFENKPVTTDGKTAAECAKALVDAGADIVGINCLRSPEHTLPLMEEMRKAVSVPLACQPVGYRTPKDSPRLHEPAPVPLRARPRAAQPQGDGRLRPPGQGPRRGLHRLVLRRRGHPRARDGPRPRQGSRRSAPLARRLQQAHVGLRVLQARGLVAAPGVAVVRHKRPKGKGPAAISGYSWLSTKMSGRPGSLRISRRTRT